MSIFTRNVFYFYSIIKIETQLCEETLTEKYLIQLLFYLNSLMFLGYSRNSWAKNLQYKGKRDGEVIHISK